MTITFKIEANESIETFDRYISRSEIRLSDAASDFIAGTMTEIKEITLEVMANLMQQVAASGLPEVAMELAGIFSDIARELMRGRRCSLQGC